jgi:quinol monooxygenase YgiN
MHEAPDDPSLFLFHENWTSEGDLTRHFETPHITRWVELTKTLLAEPLDLTTWRKVG